MNNQQQKKLVLIVIGLVVLLLVFFTGSYVGERSARKELLTIPIPNSVPVTPEQFEPFWKVWNVLSEKFVTATTTDTQQRIWSSIQGLASSQGDPYTVFFDPKEAKKFFRLVRLFSQGKRNRNSLAKFKVIFIINKLETLLSFR